jgi:SAM-dependent methyltransferase
VISAPFGAPRSGESSIGPMPGVARYDGIADYYDEHLRAFTLASTEVVRELLGQGPGRCLDLGCGTGLHFATLTDLGWTIAGIDLSADQLRLASERGGEAELVRADASELPFADGHFDAVVSIFIHTDMDDYAAAVREGARVLVHGGRFVHVGLHPCFAGPFSRYMGEDAPPELFPGYRDSGWTDDAPGLGEGLRRMVGTFHLPLADLLQACADAGLVLERFREPQGAAFPRVFALAARKP